MMLVALENQGKPLDVLLQTSRQQSAGCRGIPHDYEGKGRGPNATRLWRLQGQDVVDDPIRPTMITDCCHGVTAKMVDLADLDDAIWTHAAKFFEERANC